MALDFSKEMLAEANHQPPSKPVAAICADARSLPIAGNTIDLIFSNLLLQHCPDPLSILKEVRRVLRFPGVFTFTTLGPKSLVELGEAWAGADNFSHIAPVLNMHDLGDALIYVGFSEPVMYTETLTITYKSLARAMADLRGVGSITTSA